MKQAAVGLVLLFVLIYLLPLGVRPLVVPDESRYAEIPREMLATGDWVVPRLNGLRYFEKPPLGYWLTAIALELWGQTRFAVRWTSAVATGLTALLVGWFAWRSTRDGRVALLSAAILLSSVEVFALGIYNVLDAPFSFFLTAGLVFFFFAYDAQRKVARVLCLALCGAACGSAFLTKGLLGFAIPAAVVGPFLILEKRWRALFTWPWLPLAVAAVVALPWSLAIHRREPDFWRYFFWVEHIQRFVSRENAPHAEPFWYYIPVLLGGFLPWTFLLPAAWSGLRHNRPWPPWLRFAAAAFGVPFVLVSIAREKLGSCILPCYPWLAICVATGLWKCEEIAVRGWGRTGLLFSALIAALAAGVGLYLQISQTSLMALLYAEHETWKGMLISAGFGFWALAALLAITASSPGERWALYTLSPALLMFVVHWAIPEAFHNRKAPEAFLRQFADRVPPEAVIVSDTNLAPLVCWIFKRNDVYWMVDTVEFGYGLSSPDAAERFLTADSFKALIRRHAPEGPVVLIAEKQNMEKYWKGRIPDPGFRAENEKFFIATFRMSLGP